MGIFKLLFGSAPTSSAGMYKVTTKGTGQLNGPVNINKTVEMEAGKSSAR